MAAFAPLAGFAVPSPEPVITKVAAFASDFSPRLPTGRIAIPARRRYSPTVSRRTPVASSMHRSPTAGAMTEIHKELERHREFCLQNEREIYTDAAAGEDPSLTLYCAEDINVLDLLHAALYVKWYVLQEYPSGQVQG